MMIPNTMEAGIIFLEKRRYAYLALEGTFKLSKIIELEERLNTLCLKKTVHFLIVDLSKLVGYKHSDIINIKEIIVPIITKSRLFKTAFLIPENPIGFKSLTNFIELPENVHIEVFRKMEHAEAWMFSSEEFN